MNGGEKMDTQKTTEEKINELIQIAQITGISMHTINNVDEVLKKLDRMATIKKSLVGLDNTLNEIKVFTPKIKQLLYKEMLILAEESMKCSGTDLCDMANAMTNLAETIIKIH